MADPFKLGAPQQIRHGVARKHSGPVTRSRLEALRLVVLRAIAEVQAFQY
jgi:hypothetical protein